VARNERVPGRRDRERPRVSARSIARAVRTQEPRLWAAFENRPTKKVQQPSGENLVTGLMETTPGARQDTRDVRRGSRSGIERASCCALPVRRDRLDLGPRRSLRVAAERNILPCVGDRKQRLATLRIPCSHPDRPPDLVIGNIEMLRVKFPRNCPGPTDKEMKPS